MCALLRKLRVLDELLNLSYSCLPAGEQRSQLVGHLQTLRQELFGPGPAGGSSSCGDGSSSSSSGGASTSTAGASSTSSSGASTSGASTSTAGASSTSTSTSTSGASTSTAGASSTSTSGASTSSGGASCCCGGVLLGSKVRLELRLMEAEPGRPDLPRLPLGPAGRGRGAGTSARELMLQHGPEPPSKRK
ncbi:hypothetical protein GPECTOR_76g783 [Gonium pectorale]|uniref:Uncharacterized protein n=1 Tax=Gonium pectorale TaxID=33097 RepID=A0A150G266_GONPE|nr:hypothetical protein GPECTOR_76g783 [Gonium pectorale]|eukprot:KXZ43962.1 hypothetical protein GPECTOR_76g783 [Gonium pectorale]